MDFLIILAVIVWIVSSAVSKKKKREAEATRQQAQQETAAPRQGAAPQPQYKPAPHPQQERPQQQVQPVFDPYYSAAEQTVPVPHPAQHTGAPTRMAGPVQARVRQSMTSQLTQIQQSAGSHVIEASSISGHAHEESSLTGITQDCGPATVRPWANQQPGTVPATTSPSAFCWNSKDVRNGLVLAEILGKPKALRKH